jgi:hypothetical protein
MNISTRESVASAFRAPALNLALFLALAVAAVPLAGQARANGGHSEGSAGEAPHGRSSDSGGDRGSWNHGGGSSGGSGSSGGGSTASPSGSGSSGNDGSTAQPRSGSGGDRGQWNNRDRGNRGGDRRHRGGRSGRHRGGYVYGSPYHYNPWWGWWGWGWGWGEPYGYGGGYGRYGYGEGDGQGALDLDIWPADTQVWLDGQYVGTVDDFDGFPTYLWLEKGTYDLVFYRDGFQTLARQYSIYPGLTIDVGDRLVQGTSIRPEDLATKTHVRRDTRVEEERELSERVDRDRDRYRDDDGRDLDPAGDDEQGRLILSIEPDDASVYLDGKFVGTAEEISRLHRGLVVDAGQHRISVVRPGRRGSEQTVTVRPGGEQEVDIELEESNE